MRERVWSTQRLGDVAVWMSGGTPSTENPDYWGGDIPWISAASLTNFDIKNSERRLTALGVKNGTRVAPPGATIFVVRGMSLKSEFRVGVAQRAVAFGQDCKALVPHKGIDPRYLGWAIKASTPKILAMVDEAGHGTGRLETRLVANHHIGVPDLKEQRRIAEILDAVDQQIAETVGWLAKAEQLRISTTLELLARGDWPTRRVDELLADVDPAMRSGPFGSALLKEELVESGVPLLGIDNVEVENFRSVFHRFVSEDKFHGLRRYEVRPNDIMITIMGTVGRCCVVPKTIGRALSSKHTWTISLHPDHYLPQLACVQINHAPWALDHLARDTQGGIMAAIRSETLKSLPLPVPPIDEQIVIERVLQGWQDTIGAERCRLTELGNLKNALMDDLLTGRVRVPTGAAE
jgi:type I restriction enzyme, S subunit